MVHIPYLCSVCVANVHGVFQLFVHYSEHIFQTTCVHIQLSNSKYTLSTTAYLQFRKNIWAMQVFFLACIGCSKQSS